MVEKRSDADAIKREQSSSRKRPRVRRLRGGLRYAEPASSGAGAMGADDLEQVARDCGFPDAAAHERWRQENGVVGRAIRRR